MIQGSDVFAKGGLLIAAVIFVLAFGFAGCAPQILDEAGFAKCSMLREPSDMKCVPGGPFLRGSARTAIQEDTGQKVKDESPEETVSVSTFFMDTNEVTYSQYQECVKAGKCPPAGPKYRNYDRPNQPMVGLNWFHARDYCTWKGKRLPTEAEFEKASRGPKGELYPWGNEPADCAKAVIRFNGRRSCDKGPEHGITFDVGSRPAYRYGLNDIAGNSWEWVNDWYSPSYTECGAACRGKDPKGPCGGADNCPGHDKRIVRGGSWYWDAEYALGSNRRPHFPGNNPYHHFGFRCARSVDVHKDVKNN